MKNMISVRGLCKSYGEGDSATHILKDVSFEMKEGEFLCIMGPSGSGKTTLLHLLSALDRPSSGEVLLDGEDLSGLTANEATLKRRATIGHVFQFFNLMPNLSCYENIGLPLAIKGRDPDEEIELMRLLVKRFGIEHRAHALPHQLSGGEMQRTSIARALAGGQPLLLCDEPTGNLSQKAGREIMEILRQVCEVDQKSVLLVTHNPRDATFADRILFLVDGELSEQSIDEGPNISVDRVHETLAALHI